MTHDDLERLTPEQRDWKLRDGVHISSSLQKRLRLAREQQREQEAGWSREFEWPSWGMPVATQIESFSCLFPFPCAVCFSIGRGRKTMEDRHLAASISVNILGNEKTAHVFGVFDGHLSSCASEFVQKELLFELQTQIKRMDGIFRTPKEIIWNALKMTFVSLHRNFLSSRQQGMSQEEFCCGTTAVVAMVLDRELWVANVGDSRAILHVIGSEESMQLTEDMKPEKSLIPGMVKAGLTALSTSCTSRIAKRGGWVSRDCLGTARICGILSTGGAIGDFGIPGITARPFITMFDLSSRPPDADIELILCCDGVTDTATTSQIATTRKQLRHEQQSAEEIAKAIVRSAGSSPLCQDNLTCLVAQLNPSKKGSLA